MKNYSNNDKFSLLLGPDNHTVELFGSAHISSYEQALSSITYINNALEPTGENRTVIFQVSDSVHSSNELVGTIFVRLEDDNPLILSCDPGIVDFIEGSGPINLAESLMLSDVDSNHEISSAIVLIENSEVGDAINLTPSGSFNVQTTTESILIVGVGNAAQYQV